tara:strand:- start:501 stop:725 length:225 start_codon:yes stop_codon:yes gene_type:complete
VINISECGKSIFFQETKTFSKFLKYEKRKNYFSNQNSNPLIRINFEKSYFHGLNIRGAFQKLLVAEKKLIKENP